MDLASAFSFDMSYCGLPPSLETLWSRWNFDPILLGVLLSVGCFGFFWLRTSEPGRKAAFAAALGLSAILFISPLCALTVALFSARVAHHMVLTMLVAPLLASTLPASWARHTPLRPVALTTGILWLWHAPNYYEAAFQQPALYWLMQLSLLAGFTWLWLNLLRGASSLHAGLAALASAIQMGMLGALLVFASQPLYATHLDTTLSFSLSPLDDQQLGGLIMWVPANLPLLALALWRLLSLLRPPQPAAS